MEIRYDCPGCLRSDRAEIAGTMSLVGCRSCGWTRDVPHSEVTDEAIRSCLICSCPDLWRQKRCSLQARLLALATAAGVGVGIWLLQGEWPFVVGSGLLTFWLISRWGRQTVLTCYRCRARYFGVLNAKGMTGFQSAINKRYRAPC